MSETEISGARTLVIDFDESASVLAPALTADCVCDLVRRVFTALRGDGTVATFGLVVASHRSSESLGPRVSTFSRGDVFAVAAACASLLEGQRTAGESDPRLAVAVTALRGIVDDESARRGRVQSP